MGQETAAPGFLKECMADALLRLMEHKRFDAITVTEITELAQVGRATYYRSFKSKEEVLVYKVDLLMDAWVQREKGTPYPGEREIFISLFRYLLTVRRELETVVKAGMENVLLRANYRVFAPDGQLSVAEQYKRCYHSMGLSAVILSWIKRGMRETPEEMAGIVVRTLFWKEPDAAP